MRYANNLLKNPATKRLSGKSQKSQHVLPPTLFSSFVPAKFKFHVYRIFIYFFSSVRFRVHVSFFSTIFLRSKVGFPKATPLVGGRETQMISKGLLVFGDIEVALKKHVWYTYTGILSYIWFYTFKKYFIYSFQVFTVFLVRICAYVVVFGTEDVAGCRFRAPKEP